MLQVTKKEIQNLKDDELRELIKELCISSLRECNISSKCVISGGNQDASDGGVDIRIKSDTDIIQDNYISNKNTIIQVKVPKMPPTSIKNEMKPKDILRSCIKELADLGGSYIIVSSSEDLTDPLYNARIDMMKQCVANLKKSANISFEFYDCDRIATWVNKYPGMISWVKYKNGTEMSGWQNHDQWTNTNPEFNKPFLLNDESFLYENNYDENSKIYTLTAINNLRKLLNQNGSAIRIAGLSGVGKTRLAYALFDGSIGSDFLDSNLLLYCDINDDPTPTPLAIMQHLVATKQRAILIIDNCEKKMHTKLVQQAKSLNSLIS